MPINVPAGVRRSIEQLHLVPPFVFNKLPPIVGERKLKISIYIQLLSVELLRMLFSCNHGVDPQMVSDDVRRRMRLQGVRPMQ